MILASVLAVAVLFIHAGSQAAGRSYADAVFELAGRSVLSEYDLTLQKRYGLFAVHTDEREAEEKIEYYCDYSFHDNALKEAVRGRDYMDVLKIKLDSVHVSLKGYSMTDTGLFERQILDCMKTGLIKDIFADNNTDSAAGAKPDSTANPHNPQALILKNEQIINGLPSSGYQAGIFPGIKQIAENGLPNLTEIKTGAKDTCLVDEYILGRFLNRLHGHKTKDTFFKNEVEYILKGGFNDQGNYNAVKSDIFILRNVLNLIHIGSDPEKQRKVAEIAAALTLGEGEPVGAAAVAEAWALAETENDMRLLEDGKQVAVVKSKDNWALPISNTLEYLWKKDYVKPKNMSGGDYEDYLRILLYLEDREEKLLRCMDLIQINMKGSYDGDFDWKEYYGGIQFVAVAMETKFTYIQKY